MAVRALEEQPVEVTLYRPCPEPGCPKLTPGGRCAEHAGEASKRDNARRNKHARREVYDHPDWPTTRGLVFVRDGLCCVKCGRRVGPGTEAGAPICAHWPRSIAELRELGLNPFDPDYCVTQCGRCSGRLDGGRGAAARRA